MPSIDFQRAKEVLTGLFKQAEESFQARAPFIKNPKIIKATEIVFLSKTQSYREVLLGCALARYLNREINIRHPYVSQGADSFNGRSLDEEVINPFLQDKLIPSSKGAYLAVFRRNVKLDESITKGLKHKAGYEAMLEIITILEESSSPEVENIIIHLLFKFIELREAAVIPVAKISRLSLEQFKTLIERILSVQSGGFIPVLLAVAMLHTLKKFYSLDWSIEWQGINVADKASGAGGDITVKQNEKMLLSIEVTERPIEKARVVSTFNTKIVRGGIEEYLFVYSNLVPAEDAYQIARTYFSQGHEINFLKAQEWIVNNLATMGQKGRRLFNEEFVNLLDSPLVSSQIKVSWNEILKEMVSA